MAGTKQGKQESNQEPIEQRGYKKLNEGKRNGLYTICETDKSNKIVVADPESYVTMGKTHIKRQRGQHA